ncbi:MAG: leucine-rich repeat domain-containing protein, partial [Clostridia bacterium]|nr:leucine-rich repeat domain-containing protein [Clostridia bacterium]
SNCTALESVTFGDGLQSIGNGAFSNCTALESVTFGDGLQSIGNGAFSNCTALESVTFGNGLQSIGERAFYNCTALESVILPEGVTSIGGNAFYCDEYWNILLLCNKDTTTAATIAISGYPYAFLDGTDEDNLIRETVNAKLSYTIDKRTRTLTVTNDGTMVSFASFTAPWVEYQAYITDVVIEPGCTSVSSKAFQNCYNIKRVALPDGIEKIDGSAFNTCTHLTAINLPDGVETIGSSAFRYCYALESVTFGDGLQSIGDSAFYGCTALESVTFGDSLQSIGNDAFANCTALKSIVIPDSVTSVGSYAFQECRALQTVVIGDGVTSIPYYAFSGCSALETVSVGESVQTINEGAFSGCSSLATVVLPASVTSLSSRAFPMKALKDIYIYSDNCSIAEDAIYYSATIHAYQGSTAETFADTYGYSFVPITDAPPHEHDKTLVPGYAATCTAAGLTDGYKCSVCGVWFQKQKEIKALGHNYQAVETVPATETETGYIRYECSRCDAGYTETLPVLTHEHIYAETERVNATCLEDGYVTYTCAGCGHSYTDLLPASGHSFGAWKTFLPTEAGQQGIDVRFCDVCGVYELRESESVSGGSTTPAEHTHSFVELERKEPDCENAGYVRAMCACGAGTVEVLAALGHDYQIGECVLETCTTAGYTPFVCTRCGNEIQTDLVPALGHLWNDGEVTTAPTCSAEGVTTYTCTREGCGETMKKVLPKDPNAHSFNVTTVAPTCVDAGYTSHACRYCRYGYTDNLVPALGHIDEDGNKVCDRCGVTIDYGTLTEEQQNCRHDWSSKDFSAGNMASPANCVSAATYYLICTKCGANARNVPGAKDKVVADPTGKPDPNAHPADKLKVTKAAVPATCRTAGETEEKTCTLCGKVAVESTLTPSDPNAHVAADGATANCSRGITCVNCGKTLQKDPNKHPKDQIRVIKTGKEPTCGTAGYKAVLYCTACEKMIQTDEVIPATGKHTQKTAATCSKKAVCTVCGMEYGDLDTTKHNLERRAAVAVSCTTDGSKEYWECKDCKKLFSDYEGTMETTEAALVIKADGQSHTDANDDGVCDRCGTVLREPEPQEEEPQGFFAKIGAFFRNLFDRIFGIFRR